MQPASPASPASRPSRFWEAFFPRFYRSIRLTEPLLRRWLRDRTIGDTVGVTVIGRHSGVPRTVLLGLLLVDGCRYVGHPASGCAWTRNLDAAGTATLTEPGRPPVDVRATHLLDGPEREAVIRATFRQHPFPGNVIYWLARRHIRAVGRFYRLESIE